MQEETQIKISQGKVVRDRYIIEDLLGQGGFGAVYRVKDRRVKGNVFALKEVEAPERRQREDFLFEGEVLRRLDHPALPRVYRVFDEPDKHLLYMLMDYVAGPNLEQLRTQQPGKRFTLSSVVKMMAPIADALSYLHTQQPPIIHRDVKPSNIIIPTSGENAVLVDFGIAKEYDQDATTTAVRHCSPGYGAPEQYTSGTGTQTDIYGFGATLYTLLTGVVPIDALYRITRMSVNRADPLVPVQQVVPDIPLAVAEAIQRSLAVNSIDRFATVKEFWAVLESQVAPVKDPVTDPGQVPITSADHEEVAPVNVPVEPVHLADVNTLTENPYPSTGDDETETETLPVRDEPVSSPPPVSNVPPASPRRSRRRWLVPLLVAVVVLILGGLSAEAWLNSRQGTPVPAPVARQTPAVTKTVAPTVKPTATKAPTKVATAKPTANPPAPAPANPPAPDSAFPGVVGTYSGSIHNTPADVDSTITLSNMSQQQGAISGHLTLGPGLQGDGDFTGSVTRDKKIQFLVPSFAGHLPLFFQGQFQPNGSIVGNYCSFQNNQCDNNSGGGYGTWNVAPNGSPSASLSPSNILEPFSEAESLLKISMAFKNNVTMDF
ncbi:hypothetical protein KDA_04190 [Dictyobacter alpinus]|uniref:Protein kinase domain-containing protein n=1 Tax=Dictyobacter alpinus TaxID=2014873 RepID=A0A402B0Q1_9CHLR|nr:serine/threonine-protein kinase [Dictyobacter alpinus]GCE24935.1 hypothetical protein KDA_04190 [Dictyobacter alpinus]